MSTASPPPEQGQDPRIYMAAERTYLAWIRTSIALIAFGFVIARFGFFLRSVAIPGAAARDQGSGFSLALGLCLIGVGVAVCVISALRHRRYVEAIDAGRFRAAFGTTFAFSLAALLVLAAAGMAIFLSTL
jgi:putative membrane protein